MKFTPENITELKPNEIFVFGSNMNGAHAGGAARLAFDKFGAQWGVAVGRTGQCYAIPTLSYDMRRLGLPRIQEYIKQMFLYATWHSDLTFYLTKIGCGIAGYSVKEMAMAYIYAKEDFIQTAKKCNSDTEKVLELIYIPREFYEYEQTVKK